MKKIRLSALVFGLFIISCSSRNASGPRTAKMLLYEISGNNLADTSYIFGTLHFVPREDFYIPEIIHEKLLMTDALVIETNIDIPIKQQIAIAERSILPGSQTLKNYVSSEVYDETLLFMLDSLNFSESRAEKYMHLKPLYLMGPLLIGYYGRVESYEKEFVKTAEKNKLDLLFLEPVEFQLDLLDSISIEDQVKDFTIYRMLQEYEEMLQVYLEQDLDKLEAFVTATSDYREYEEVIINIRNRNWVPLLGTMMSDQSIFIAVGAGHLYGDTGLLNLLMKQGYTINQVVL